MIYIILFHSSLLLLYNNKLIIAPIRNHLTNFLLAEIRYIYYSIVFLGSVNLLLKFGRQNTGIPAFIDYTKISQVLR